jgi:hypothetical protein
VISTTPRPLYPRERPGTHCTGGWGAPGPVWTCAKNLAPTVIRSPDRPALASRYTDLAIIIIIIIIIGGGDDGGGGGGGGDGGGGLMLCPVLVSTQKTGHLTKCLTCGCVRECWNECIKPVTRKSDITMGCQPLYQVSGLHH